MPLPRNSLARVSYSSLQKKVTARAWENTFEAIAREWHENKKSAWSERYAEDVLERIASNIFPYLGTRPTNEITPPELLSVLRKIEARRALYQANRLRESCALVFRTPSPQAEPNATAPPICAERSKATLQPHGPPLPNRRK